MKKDGWITAWPLDKHSTLNEVSLLKFIGIAWPRIRFFVGFNFNLYKPFKPDPKATISFSARFKNDNPPLTPVYTFTNLNRFHLDIRPFLEFKDFVSQLTRWHKHNYSTSLAHANECHAKTTFVEGDWSEYAEIVFTLYRNVAQRHGEQLYDLNFFKLAAKNPDYKLLCAWINDKLIGVYILVEELPTIHSILCGFDYEYSTKCCAYSWMHFELIRIAIESKRYENVDVGFTGEKAKESIGFDPVPACVDVYAHTPLSRFILKTVFTFANASIDSEGNLKLSLKFGQNRTDP